MSRSHKVALLRIAFGLVWAVDAAFKWQLSFINNFHDTTMMAAEGQPFWLKWWFDMWMGPLMNHGHAFAITVACIETALALGLLLGVFRTYVYIGGAIFAFLIWSLGEGFGGPYGADSTDIGSAVIYIFVFITLGLLDSVIPAALSIDARIGRRRSNKNRLVS